MPQGGRSDPPYSGSMQQATGSPQPAADQDERARQIIILDAFGEKREGVLLRVARWDDSATPHLNETRGDFRIVILGEPPAGAVPAPPATVVCAPARPAERPVAVREAAVVAYGTEADQGRVTPTEARLLSRGNLYAPVALRITPQDVFGGGEPRFELLARELLTAEALAGYLGPLALALSAPDAPPRLSLDELISALRPLLAKGQLIPSGLDRALGPEADAALDRLSLVSAAEDAESFLIAVRRLYPWMPALLEDVYLLRALVERLPDALEALSMRALMAEAGVAATDADLSLDKTIVMEQLQFASLVAEPQRLNAARTAFAQFHSRYRSRYEAHHRAYWGQMARLHARLLEGKAHAQALEKVNTLTELGPPVGEGALAAHRELLEGAVGCPLIAGVEEELGDSAVCPACGLRLDQEAPSERVTELLQRIERALGRQMARLSSVGVRQVLERSGDARVERFLKVVQTAQLSSLVDIMDDDLVGYLRRFLVESRIGALLDSTLSRLQQGTAPKAEEAHEALRDIARVLQRAFRASGRALPPPRTALQDGAVKKPKRRDPPQNRQQPMG